MYVFSGLNGLDVTIPTSELVSSMNVNEPPNPYDSLANLLVTATNNIILKLRDRIRLQLVSSLDVQLELLIIFLCVVTLIRHGSITETSLVPCYTVYGVCYGACSPLIATCELCKLTPFPCSGPCGASDGCTHACSARERSMYSISQH